MRVKFIGHDSLLLTEYNGKRYAFHKNVPVEITSEIYNNIILSGHISASEVVLCEEPKKEEPKRETIVEKIKEAIKPTKGKKKR